MKPITKDDISAALKVVGVHTGQTLMVHTSLSKIGYVCGGAQTVIQALTEAVGECGTIMMPTQSWKNLDPEDGVHDEVAVEDWQIIRDNWPAYDKLLTPTNTMGAVAEMFRSWPGTIRSDHPARSVSAWGRHAAYPDAQLRVQKTQITFYNPRVFACASLLRARRKAELPKTWLTVTLGLPYRLESPRTAICTQVYPGRWTTHIVVSSPAEIDGELLGWVGEAYRFAITKSACDSRLLDMEIHNRGKEVSP